jgi:hypothetical protein
VADPVVVVGVVGERLHRGDRHHEPADRDGQ